MEPPDWTAVAAALLPSEPAEVHERVGLALEDAEHAREALAARPRARLYTFNRLLARADPPDRAVEYVAGCLCAILDVELEDAQNVVIQGRTLSELMVDALRDRRRAEVFANRHTLRRPGVRPGSARRRGPI